MIGTFDYYRPHSIQEAVDLFEKLDLEGQSPVYYSGGTEIITFHRLNLIHNGAVIDIKSIPECMEWKRDGSILTIGSALSLTAVENQKEFPLLSTVCSEVADHTARNKITAGGNICGETFYREVALPFLLSDAHLVIGGKGGVREVEIHELFKGHLQLNKGEFLLQLLVQQSFLESPYISIKRRRQWNTGYPLITVSSLRDRNRIRLAISGLYPYPFRAWEVETELNRPGTSEQRIEAALKTINGPVLEDEEGSANYRLFVLKNILYDVMEHLGGEK